MLSTKCKNYLPNLGITIGGLLVAVLSIGCDAIDRHNQQVIADQERQRAAVVEPFHAANVQNRIVQLTANREFGYFTSSFVNTTLPILLFSCTAAIAMIVAFFGSLVTKLFGRTLSQRYPLFCRFLFAALPLCALYYLLACWQHGQLEASFFRHFSINTIDYANYMNPTWGGSLVEGFVPKLPPPPFDFTANLFQSIYVVTAGLVVLALVEYLLPQSHSTVYAAIASALLAGVILGPTLQVIAPLSAALTCVVVFTSALLTESKEPSATTSTSSPSTDQLQLRIQQLQEKQQKIADDPALNASEKTLESTVIQHEIDQIVEMLQRGT